MAERRVHLAAGFGAALERVVAQDLLVFYLVTQVFPLAGARQQVGHGLGEDFFAAVAQYFGDGLVGGGDGVIAGDEEQGVGRGFEEQLVRRGVER